MDRKIVQISVLPESERRYARVVALCNDGTVWTGHLDPNDLNTEWKRVPAIPQAGFGEDHG